MFDHSDDQMSALTDAIHRGWDGSTATSTRRARRSSPRPSSRSPSRQARTATCDHRPSEEPTPSSTCAGLTSTTAMSRSAAQRNRTSPSSLIFPTLTQQEGSISELDDGTVLHPETIRRLACDASVTRIVLAPDSQPLDIGRKTRVVPAGMRRALVARDRGCNQAGCDRPARWCDAHHIRGSANRARSRLCRRAPFAEPWPDAARAGK